MSQSAAWYVCPWEECPRCGSGVLAQIHQGDPPVEGDGAGNDPQQAPAWRVELDDLLVCEEPACRLQGRWTSDDDAPDAHPGWVEAYPDWGNQDEVMDFEEHARLLAEVAGQDDDNQGATGAREGIS